jgi:hypothetical protein
MISQFCAKPDPDVLADIFKNLLRPRKKYFFVYFSDDSCISVKHRGVTTTYNMDIKSCDASHGPAVFDFLLNVVPHTMRDDMKILIEQCQAKICIRSVEDPKHRVKLKPYGPMLYSGSTITTIINNFANLMIALSIERQNAVTPAEIKHAANLAGYIVTLEECTHYSDIQFLKHSPAYDVNGTMRALLNIGVLLRLSGTCKGGLPGKGPYMVRARAFQAALMKGVYPRMTFPLIDNMRESCSAEVALSQKTQDAIQRRVNLALYNKDGATVDHVQFTSEEIYRRYRLNALEIDAIDNEFGRAPVGGHYTSSGANTILQRDYGLSTQEIFR